MGNMIRKERGRIMRVRTRDSGQRSWIPFKQWERDVSPMLFLIESLSDEPGHHISPPHPSFPSNKRVQCAFLPPSSLSLSDSRWLWDSGPVWERWPGIRLALCLSASVCERHFRVSRCEIIRVGVWESWYLKGFMRFSRKTCVYRLCEIKRHQQLLQTILVQQIGLIFFMHISFSFDSGLKYNLDVSTWQISRETETFGECTVRPHRSFFFISQ